MKISKSIQLCLFAAVFICSSSVFSAEEFTAKIFAGPDGKLNQQQAALYIAHRDKEPLSKFIPPGEVALNSQKLVDVLGDKLDDLRSRTGHEAPWTWQELDAAFGGKTEKEKEAGVPAWKEVPGITKKIELGKSGSEGTAGPFRLRKNSDELAKSLSDAKGAAVGYSDNHLVNGHGAWNSEGALDYPFKFNLYQGGFGRSLETEVGPMVNWKLIQTQGNKSKEVEELGFAVPVTAYWSPGASRTNPDDRVDRALSRLVVLQAKPYFNTDFSFRHEIYGLEASTEFVGSLFGSRVVVLGGFQNIGNSGIQYQLRVLPKLDYSVTEQTGIHTSRKDDDDWVRVGGLASFDIRLGAASYTPLDFGVSYQLLQSLSGTGGYSSLFKAHVTWWLSENIGLMLEYAEGETPVADKDVELTTLGVQLKF